MQIPYIIKNIYQNFLHSSFSYLIRLRTPSNLFGQLKLLARDSKSIHYIIQIKESSKSSKPIQTLAHNQRWFSIFCDHSSVGLRIIHIANPSLMVFVLILVQIYKFSKSLLQHFFHLAINEFYFCRKKHNRGLLKLSFLDVLNQGLTRVYTNTIRAFFLVFIGNNCSSPSFSISMLCMKARNIKHN